MRSFSEREGYKPMKINLQIGSMDEDLRISLWNVLTIFYWDEMKKYNFLSNCDNMDFLFKRIWQNYFIQPFDSLNNYWRTTYGEIRDYFFKCEWNEVYDFIEFVANNFPDKDDKRNRGFMAICNSILEQELSGYRFVDGIITPITSDAEISAIEEALEITNPLKGVHTHLKTSLTLLSDRKNPDYRNSIKEAISAIECICKLLTEDKNAKLGNALKIIEDKVALHPALKDGFNKLYGWTSNEDGIRHSLMEESNISFEDAKYMLVSCSAFVNYLIVKAEKAGIKLESK